MAKHSTRSLADIEAQIASLEAKAAVIREKEKADVVAKVRVAIAHYGITADQLGLVNTARVSKRARPAKAAPAPARKPVAAKYRDGQGNTWTGRGNKPRWLAAELAQGRTVEDFLIKA